jgi:ELWxxDGT repeat protein
MAKFIFSQQNPNGTTDLYSTDGTAAGTVDLDLAALGFSGSNTSLNDFVSFDGKEFFVGVADETGAESVIDIFSTDGTVAGTTLVDVGATIGGPFGPTALEVVNGALLVSGKTELGTPGIWASKDGVNFTQIENGVETSAFTISNGIGYFDADAETVNGSNTGSPGLWRTDGTSAGTYSINAAGVTLNPGGFAAVGGGKTVFVNESANGDGALWVTDGTAAGTHQIVVAALGTQVTPGGAETNGKAIFTATDAAGQQSVWATDGTAAGTVELVVSGPAGAPVRHSSDFTAWNGKVIFSTGYALAVTDGTKAGTVALPTGIPLSFATTGSTVFVNSDGGSGPVLSVSDGTVAGTHALAISGLASITGPLTAVGSDVVFEGTDVSGKTAFFSTDGTAAGSQELTSPVNGSAVIAALPAATSPPSSGIAVLPSGPQNYTAGSGSTVFAGNGNDTVTASDGKSTVVGNASGSLTFIGGQVSSVVFAGGEQASIFGGSGGGDSVVGGSGTLTLVAQKGDAVFGGSGALAVTGSTSGADSIIGGAGALTVAGRGGNMLVVGGTGASDILTGNGAALVFSGSGNMSLTGGTGSLQVLLESGKTTVAEGSGPTSYDVVKGEAGGTEILNGFRPGTDTLDLFGYAGADLRMSASGGSTTLSLSDGTKIQLVGVTDTGHSVSFG